MVFSSLIFLYAFFPLSLLGCVLCRTKGQRNTVLLIASLIFYAWGEPVYVLLLMFMALSSWFCALKVVDGETTTVMSYSGGSWKEVATVPYKVSGSEMELSIPASILGVGGKSVSFDFKWADNIGELVDPISLCLHGDTAPNRRFNYRFIFEK